MRAVFSLTRRCLGDTSAGYYHLLAQSKFAPAWGLTTRPQGRMIRSHQLGSLWRLPTMPEIKRLSHTHDQIIDWLLANPMLPNSACAAHFQYTEPWLSTIIHSDLFQAKLHERQEQVFGECVLSVKDRITALAHDSMKRLHEKIIVENDVDKLNCTADLMLKALGFGPKPGGLPTTVQVNQTFVSKDMLAEARAQMEGRAILPAATQDSARVPLAIQASAGVVE